MPFTLTVGVSSEVPTTLVADKRAGVSCNAAVACANRGMKIMLGGLLSGFDLTVA
jgi:hypothetical protein